MERIDDGADSTDDALHGTKKVVCVPPSNLHTISSQAALVVILPPSSVGSCNASLVIKIEQPICTSHGPQALLCADRLELSNACPQIKKKNQSAHLGAGALHGAQVLVEQLLVLGPWQASSHCAQCANCCIHNVGIPVQVDLQQNAKTVMGDL